MSADNWTQCPKCLGQAQEEKARKIRKANEAYGKVSRDEYENLLKAAQEKIHLDSTLREDYELGIQQRIFKIRYSASCQKCGFRYEYNDSEKVYRL